MSARAVTLWTFAITSIALFMVSLDNLVVSTAIPVIRADLDASLEELSWTVNAYTLTFAVLLLTGAALGDRFGRRAHVRDRRRHLHGRLGRGRARAERRGAQHRPGRAGPRRRDRDAADPDDPLGRRAAAKRGLALGAWGAIGGLAIALGPVVGGAVVEGFSLAVHLLAQRPDRILLVPLALPGSPRATARRASSTSPASASSAPACSGSSGADPRQRAGLDEPGDPHRVRPRLRPRRRVRRLGAARPGADAADDASSAPGVLAREPRLAVHVLRDVRLDLPADPVLPDRPGLLAARGSGLRILPWTLAADVRRPVRRARCRQGQPEADPRRRADAAGDRRSAGSRSSRRRPRRTSRSSIPFILAGVGMALFFTPMANLVLSSVRREQEGQASGANNAIRELGGVFGVAVLASVFARYGGYATGADVRRRRCPGALDRRRRRRPRRRRRVRDPPGDEQTTVAPSKPQTWPLTTALPTSRGPGRKVGRGSVPRAAAACDSACPVVPLSGGACATAALRRHGRDRKDDGDEYDA